MTVAHYDWKPGQAPPTIKGHSLVKHEILGDYLRLYVSTLMKKRRGDSVLKLTVVDGFAGGGRYVDERTLEIRDGSPLIILDALRDAEAAINPAASGQRRLDVQFVFIEKNDSNHRYLTSVLSESEYSKLVGDRLHVVKSSFEDQCERVFAAVEARSRSRRVIFVLDQYGYTSVPLPLIQKIFQWSPNAEVILTFATDSLIDYLRNDDSCEERLSRVGLASLPTDVETLKEEEKHQWREVIQKWLHRELWSKSGAAFYTPFFLHSVEAHRSYWLVHLSGHPKARDVMVNLHWKKNNSFLHYGDPGLNMLGMLGYSPDRDPGCGPVQQVFEFNGSARDRTFDALRIQLPERIASFRDGISYQELFARVTNETPATSDMIMEVVIEKARTRELEVLSSSSGKVRDVAKKIASDDVVRVCRQKKLFLMELENRLN